MSLAKEDARAAAGGYGPAAAYRDIDDTLAERDALRRVVARAEAGREAAKADAERLAGRLGTEEFRTKGWRNRALEAEAALQQRDRDLAAARADVMRLTALIGQGLDLVDTWQNDTAWECERAEGMRRALTIAPGEKDS
ncbi:hypothetical protein [Rhodococcus ruber]|uniref:hypothetical protein n=1 Tax=Rhodococcus ruber TaxID=1830 RepID=UPI003782FA85